jgi:hypothetical protein
LVSGAAGVIALILSGTYLLFNRFAVPPADASIFVGRKSYTLELFSSRVTLETGNLGIEVSIAAPEALNTREPNAIDVDLRGATVAEGNLVEAALFVAGGGVVVTTPYGCATVGATPLMQQPATPWMRACTSGDKATTKYKLQWFVRARENGKLYIIARMPQQVAEFLAANQDWQGFVVKNSKGWYSEREHFSSMGYDQFLFSPSKTKTLSREHPVLEYPEFEIDMSRHEVTIVLEVLSSLGVSGATYDVLSIGAAIISSALGSGWLWKIVKRPRRDRGADD